MAKKYSINVENDEVISVEVDGVQYDNPAQISDPDDRAKILLLMSTTSDMDLSVAASEPFVLPKIILPVFLGIAVLMLVIAAVSGLNTARALSREKSVPGHVVDLVVRKDSAGKEFYYPVVEFYLPDESRQTVQLSEGNWPAAYSKGEPVIVAYDPEQPLQARINSISSTASQWTLSIITGVLAMAFVIATLFARWILKPSLAEVQPE